MKKSSYAYVIRRLFTRPQAMLWTVLAVLCLGCQKTGVRESEAPMKAAKDVGDVGEFRTWYEGIEGQTLWELQRARAATAKYKNFDNALRDGYENINVVLPNMGYHYMNPDLLDATVDPRYPEILVYNKRADGSFYLSAVEYAVPLDLSATAPAGFSGSSDVWTRNTGFGLWLLHAWVWQYNPAGVFNPTNPDVPTNP